MKKALALVMAIAMVASLAAVSFAVSIDFNVDDEEEAAVKALFGVDSALFKYTSTDKAYTLNDANGEFFYGDTAYVLFYDNDVDTLDVRVATEEKTVSGLKVSADWDEGGDAVKSVEIVKKKVKSINGNTLSANGTNIYLLAIATQATEEDEMDVIGTVTLKGKTGTEENKVSIEAEVDVDFTVGYRLPADMDAVANTGKVFAYDFDAATYDDEDEWEIAFGDVTVTADVRNEKLVLLSFDDDYIEEVDEAYPDANIDYYAMTGAFRRTATVTVPAEEGSYLYEVVDGAVVAVDAEYDDWDEAFTFKTRKLGTYIVSDMELVAESVVATNPSTGAAA